ncbi:MAG: aminotransferase class I/II-fold pyridoxal phosphate-dependent enzyme [Dysosmobacter sp.]|nr:aminotransferase class I/II-fold pyridoxal phosphate-dependent enzyme [Dysosmobacter sp.]
MQYNFDQILDRSKERSKTWDPSMCKPGDIPMHGAETHYTCPYPVLEAVREVASWSVYGYPYFTDDFSNAAARFQKKWHGWDCDPAWIEFVGGIVPGIAFAIQAVTKPGDKVVLNVPAYSPFRTVIETNDRVLVESYLQVTPEQVSFDWEDMERKFSDPDVKAFILCDPHNPTGKSCTREELEKIAALSEKYGVFVIVDEVHADYVFVGRHISYPTVSEYAKHHSAVVMNPSKTFNVAGFRTAAIIVPDRETHDKINVKILAVKGISRTITGVAAFEACYDGRCDDYVEQLRAYVSENMEYVKTFFQTRNPKIRMVRPDGCFVCWLDCAGLGFKTQKELMAFLNGTGILLSDGADYFADGDGRGFVRMAYGFPRPMLREALERLEAAVNAL